MSWPRRGRPVNTHDIIKGHRPRVFGPRSGAPGLLASGGPAFRRRGWPESVTGGPVEGLGYEQIAGLKGMAVGSVKSCPHLGRGRLGAGLAT